MAAAISVTKDALDRREGAAQNALMKGPILTALMAVALLAPWLCQAQAPEGVQRDAIVIKMASTAASGFFAVKIHQPDPAGPPTCEYLIWAGECGLKKAETLELQEVTIFSPGSGNSILDDLRFRTASLTSISTPKRPEPKVTERKGSVFQTWWTAPRATSLDMVRSPAPFPWTWAIVLPSHDEIKVLFAPNLDLVAGSKSDVQASGGVVTFGKEGPSVKDQVRLTLPPAAVWCELADDKRLTNANRFEVSEVLQKIKRAARQ
jgi:hypothetical protein